MIFSLVENQIKAKELLTQYSVNGVQVDPDNYYRLVLTITEDEKAARNAQAELMLNQME